MQWTSKKTKRFWLNGFERSSLYAVIGGFPSTLSVSLFFFCGQPVAVILIIDSSKTRKSLAGVEVQSPYVIERHSKQQACYLLIQPNPVIADTVGTSVYITE